VRLLYAVPAVAASARKEATVTGQARDAAIRPDTGRWHVERHGYYGQFFVSEHRLDVFNPGIVGRFDGCDDAYRFAVALREWDELRPKVEDFNGE